MQLIGMHVLIYKNANLHVIRVFLSSTFDYRVQNANVLQFQPIKIFHEISNTIYI